MCVFTIKNVGSKNLIGNSTYYIRYKKTSDTSYGSPIKVEVSNSTISTPDLPKGNFNMQIGVVDEYTPLEQVKWLSIPKILKSEEESFLGTDIYLEGSSTLTLNSIITCACDSNGDTVGDDYVHKLTNKQGDIIGVFSTFDGVTTLTDKDGNPITFVWRKLIDGEYVNGEYNAADYVLVDNSFDSFKLNVEDLNRVIGGRLVSDVYTIEAERSCQSNKLTSSSSNCVELLDNFKTLDVLPESKVTKDGEDIVNSDGEVIGIYREFKFTTTLGKTGIVKVSTGAVKYQNKISLVTMGYKPTVYNDLDVDSTKEWHDNTLYTNPNIEICYDSTVSCVGFGYTDMDYSKLGGIREGFSNIRVIKDGAETKVLSENSTETNGITGELKRTSGDDFFQIDEEAWDTSGIVRPKTIDGVTPTETPASKTKGLGASIKVVGDYDSITFTVIRTSQAGGSIANIISCGSCDDSGNLLHLPIETEEIY